MACSIALVIAANAFLPISAHAFINADCLSNRKSLVGLAFLVAWLLYAQKFVPREILR
jgi:hypothetical protein